MESGISLNRFCAVILQKSSYKLHEHEKVILELGLVAL